MWTARIVLLVTELLLAGGWFDPLLGRRKKRLSLAALIGLRTGCAFLQSPKSPGGHATCPPLFPS